MPEPSFCRRWRSHISCERRRTTTYATSRRLQPTITSSSIALMGSILIRSGRGNIGWLPLSRRKNRGRKRDENGGFTNRAGRNRQDDNKDSACPLFAEQGQSNQHRRNED